ncbi:MAG: hypothetical protein ACTSVL_10210 [Promethearchaeota archaeon]
MLYTLLLENNIQSLLRLQKLPTCMQILGWLRKVIIIQYQERKSRISKRRTEKIQRKFIKKYGLSFKYKLLSDNEFICNLSEMQKVIQDCFNAKNFIEALFFIQESLKQYMILILEMKKLKLLNKAKELEKQQNSLKHIEYQIYSITIQEQLDRIIKVNEFDQNYDNYQKVAIKLEKIREMVQKRLELAKLFDVTVEMQNSEELMQVIINEQEIYHLYLSFFKLLENFVSYLDFMKSKKVIQDGIHRENYALSKYNLLCNKSHLLMAETLMLKNKISSPEIIELIPLIKELVKNIENIKEKSEDNYTKKIQELQNNLNRISLSSNFTKKFQSNSLISSQIKDVMEELDKNFDGWLKFDKKSSKKS